MVYESTTVGISQYIEACTHKTFLIGIWSGFFLPCNVVGLLMIGLRPIANTFVFQEPQTSEVEIGVFRLVSQMFEQQNQQRRFTKQKSHLSTEKFGWHNLYTWQAATAQSPV